MANIITQWFNRSLSNPQIVVLALLLVAGATILGFASDILAPLLVSLIIAYLLDGLVEAFRRLGVPGGLALAIVYMLFIGSLLLFLFTMFPLMAQQVRSFLQDFPAIAERGQALLMQLPQMYPQFFDESQIVDFISGLRTEIAKVIHTLLSTLFTSISGFIALLVYLVLVPLLVFFFLKDKAVLIQWSMNFLPAKEGRNLTLSVWKEVNGKISNYIRGKMIEILIIWAITWVVFAAFGLNYAALLSFLVGVSVVIPYLGVIVVTIPVAMVAYAQWGFGDDFIYLMIGHLVVQFLDGNLLVPFLFSEIINIHPVAIIAAILIFGSLWGVWGVFFAIPLATLVNAVLRGWSQQSQSSR